MSRHCQGRELLRKIPEAYYQLYVALQRLYVALQRLYVALKRLCVALKRLYVVVQRLMPNKDTRRLVVCLQIEEKQE